MSYIKYVNIKNGTKSNFRYSNGNTLPLTQCPFGMLAAAPQTDGGDSRSDEPSVRAIRGGNGWWFQPDARCIEGIRITHQPSPWLGDYASLLVTPQSDCIIDDRVNAWSGYRPEEAVLAPDYIKADFLRSRALTETTVTERCMRVRVTFDTDFNRAISIFNLKGTMHIDGFKDGILYGSTDGMESNGVAKDFNAYFVLVPATDWVDNAKTLNNDTKETVTHLTLKDGVKTAEFDISFSYISYEQALLNVKEATGRTFDDIRKECSDKWEAFLSKIQLEDADEERMKTFYSCFYRCGLFPHKAFEIDADGNDVHYSPATGKVHKGRRYTDFGFWDTARTELPLLSIIDRELYHDIVKSAISDYKENGWLPRWISIGEIGCMPSTFSDSVLAQAMVCNITTLEENQTILEASVHHGEEQADMDCYGRRGIKEYKKYGYVPCDMFEESVNLTLDYSYGDYCIAQMAKLLGDKETEERYLARSKNYENIFDKETGFMRPKDSKGNFVTPFDPYTWGGHYTEASAWQTTFAIQHDYDGLAELYGGKDKMLEKLDKLFNQKPLYRVTGCKREIHEITEMAAIDFGLCAISNQPSFVIPYIYAFLGEKEKTQYWVKKICDELFTSYEDGYPGDEDNGSMSAWYVLSILGLYPICPGDNRWVKIDALEKIKVCGMDIEELKKNY